MYSQFLFSFLFYCSLCYDFESTKLERCIIGAGISLLIFFFCQSQKFVRTLFDYDPRADDFIPCQQAGIAFKRGEILQIVSQNDSHWWQVIFEDFVI